MKKGLLFIMAMVLLAYACKKSNPADCFTSTGKVVEETRSIGPFSWIVLKDNVNLHLVQGTENKLVVKAGKNLMKNIVTYTTGDSCLEIANHSSCNWVRSYAVPIDVYLTFTCLNRLEYRSVGTVDNSDTLQLDSLKINVREGGGKILLTVNIEKLFTNIHRGTATIRCSGKVGISSVYSAGFGLIDNRNLEAKLVYLRTKSSNDVYVRATNTLVASIENIGNVYYFGNPSSVIKEGNGSGKLIPINGQ